MLPNLPVPQPDQTIESYAAAIYLANALTDWRSLMKMLFGSSNIDPGKAYFSGLGRFLQTTIGHCGTTPEELIRNHSLSGLFLPFLPDTSRHQLIEKQAHGKVQGLNRILGIDAQFPFRDDHWFCLDCMEEELRKLGYAYAHRTHQVIGVQICSRHNTPLVPLNKNDSTVSHFHGLVTVSKDPKTQFFSKTANPITSSHSGRAISIWGDWVQSTFDNTLPRLSSNARLQVIIDALVDIPRKTGEPASPPIRIEHLLLESYGEEFLCQMGLPITKGATEHWPALFIWGHAYRNHAIANLLILGALFKGPQQYISKVNALEPSTAVENFLPSGKMRSIRFRLTLPLIKALLSEVSLKFIARQYGTSEEELIQFLKTDVAFSTRRSTALWRKRDREHRRRVLSVKKQYPNMARSLLQKHAKASYTWLLKHDRDWLDREFPASRPRRFQPLPPVHGAHIDSYAVHRIKLIAEKALGSTIPIRITKQMLLENLKPASVVREVKSGTHPLAAKELNQLSESSSAYQARNMNILSLHVQAANISASKEIVRNLLIQYPKQAGIVDRIIDILFGESTPSQPLPDISISGMEVNSTQAPLV